MTIKHLPFPAAPSCPRFPDVWTPAIAEAASAHTAEAFPGEAAGIVINGEYQRLDNISSTPEHDVMLGDADLLQVAEAQLFFHSHPHGPACPSEDDMRYQQQLGIPFVIQPWPLGPAFCFGDMLDRAPLSGRAFRHGVHDCYSLCRDWYRDNLGIELVQQPRGWEWWRKGQAFYLDGFKAAGFRQIEVGEAFERGDGLLFNFTHATPMHAALVHDRDLLLHHASGIHAYDPTRLSALVPRTRWVRHATMALRYDAKGAT